MITFYLFRIQPDGTLEFTTRHQEPEENELYPANPEGYRLLSEQTYIAYLSAVQEGKTAYLDQDGNIVIEDSAPA